MNLLVKMAYIEFLVEKGHYVLDMESFIARRIRLYFGVIQQDLSVFAKYQEFLDKYKWEY